MNRILLSLALLSGCSSPSTPPLSTPADDAPAIEQDTLDWDGAVRAEVQRLEQAHPGATVRVVVWGDSRVLARFGDIEGPAPTGSTMKPLTVFAALRAGLDPSIEIDASSPVQIDGEMIHDASNNGVLTLPQAIAKSSNIAVARTLMAVPWREVYVDVATRLPLPDPAQMTMLEGVGQLDGFITEVPLRALVSAYARMEAEPEGEAVMHMLRLAVTEYGTGTAAAVPGLDVAGKTGTARRDDEQTAVFVGRVSDGATTAWIGVSVQGVPQDAYGGVVAAPAFANIAAAALQPSQAASI